MTEKKAVRLRALRRAMLRGTEITTAATALTVEAAILGITAKNAA